MSCSIHKFCLCHSVSPHNPYDFLSFLVILHHLQTDLCNCLLLLNISLNLILSFSFSSFQIFTSLSTKFLTSSLISCLAHPWVLFTSSFSLFNHSISLTLSSFIFFRLSISLLNSVLSLFHSILSLLHSVNLISFSSLPS